MANPKLKNGYMSVANELVDRFAKVSISGSEMRIIWAIWRKTWCWKDGERHKDWDIISISQLQEMTTMKRTNTWEALQSLLVKRLILKSEKGYKFNQNYDEWVLAKRLPPLVKSIQTVSQTTNETVSQKHDYKRKKETIQKKGDLRSQESRFSQEGAEIIKAFEEIDPKNKRYYKNTTQREAADFLIREYGKDRVLWVIKNLPSVNKIQYIKKSYTPFQLMENWQSVKDHFEGLKAKKVNQVAFT